MWIIEASIINWLRYGDHHLVYSEFTSSLNHNLYAFKPDLICTLDLVQCSLLVQPWKMVKGDEVAVPCCMVFEQTECVDSQYSLDQLLK